MKRLRINFALQLRGKPRQNRVEFKIPLAAMASTNVPGSLDTGITQINGFTRSRSLRRRKESAVNK